jgi:hypothetical protein
MTMEFRTVKSQIEGILNAAAVAAGTFRVIGYQSQDQSSDQSLDDLRICRVFYDSGAFPKSAGSRDQSQTHNCEIAIQLTVSKQAKGDLAALNAATDDASRAAALTTFSDSTKLADDSLDEFIDLVWNSIMTAAERDLGLPRGQVSNTWIERFEKSEPNVVGSRVVLTATMPFGCRVSEAVAGEGSQPADPTLKAVYSAIDVYMNETTKDDGLAAFRGGN